MYSLICKSDSEFFARFKELLARSRSLDLHHQRWCNPQLTVFRQRTGVNVCGIDTTVCRGENGHDDDEEGGYPPGTTYIHRTKVYTQGDKESYFADLPVDDDFQKYIEYLVEDKLKGWQIIVALGAGFCINKTDLEMGLDPDLKKGTDPTLRL